MFSTVLCWAVTCSLLAPNGYTLSLRVGLLDTAKKKLISNNKLMAWLQNTFFNQKTLHLQSKMMNNSRKYLLLPTNVCNFAWQMTEWRTWLSTLLVIFVSKKKHFSLRILWLWPSRRVAVRVADRRGLLGPIVPRQFIPHHIPSWGQKKLLRFSILTHNALQWVDERVQRGVLLFLAHFWNPFTQWTHTHTHTVCRPGHHGSVNGQFK